MRNSRGVSNDRREDWGHRLEPRGQALIPRACALDPRACYCSLLGSCPHLRWLPVAASTIRAGISFPPMTRVEPMRSFLATLLALCAATLQAQATATSPRP